MKITTTLCIIHKNQKVLLGMKKKGFGEGRWNGFGGKIKNNETIENCVKRELNEECGLDIPVKNFEKIGVIEFSFTKIPDVIENHFFKVKEFSGEPCETDEMKPKWFSIDEIPLNKMWPDDVYWMPLFLKDKKFKGKFKFDYPSSSDYTSNIIKKDLYEVDEL